MKKGFTLVELLFVMAIISILAGFAIANLNDSTRVASITSMKADIRNIVNKVRIQEQTQLSSLGNSCVTYGTSGLNRQQTAVKGVCRDFAGITGLNIEIAEGNAAYISYGTCFLSGEPKGLAITVKSKNVSGIKYVLNTCTGATMTEELDINL